MPNTSSTSLSNPPPNFSYQPTWRPPQLTSSPSSYNYVHPSRVSLNSVLIEMAMETNQALQAATPDSLVSDEGRSSLGNSASPEQDISVKQEHLDGYPNQEDFFDAVSGGAMTNGATSPAAQPLASVEAPSSGAVLGLAAPVLSDGAVSVKTEATPRPSAPGNDSKTKLWKHVIQ
jgi:hypothetical protein